MSTEHHVMELFERANPVPDPEILDVEPDVDRDLVADSLECTTMSIDEPTDRPAPKTGRRRAVPALAAAVVAVVLVGGLALVAAEDDDPVPADRPAPVTTLLAPVTTLQATTRGIGDSPGPEDAALIERFFVANNDGDTDAVMALLAPDVRITDIHDSVTGLPAPGYPPLDVFEHEVLEAWRHGQGTIFGTPACVVLDPEVLGRQAASVAWEPPRDRTTVDCSYELSDALVQAVDGTPVPVRAFLTIEDGTIAQFHLNYGRPGFATLREPFERWLEREHPEAEAALCCGGETRASAARRGAARAAWALRWAAYLEENGCEPTNECIPGDVDGDG